MKRISSRKTIEKTKNKLELLGIDYIMDAHQYLNKKLLSTIVVFIIIFLFSNILWALLISLGYYLTIDYFYLDIKIKKRKYKLEKDAINFLEILILSLENNNNLLKSLEITTKNFDNELSREFEYVLSQVKLGKSLSDSFNSIKDRIPSKIIRNIIYQLILLEKYGTSAIDSLKNSLNYLNEKYYLNQKIKLTKIPLKINIISLVFIILIGFLIIISPRLLNMLQ